MVDSEEAEAALQRVLDDAAGLPDLLDRLASARVRPDERAPTPFEGSPTRWVLAHSPWAATQFRAAIALLRDPALSSAADVLLRSLLELFAHAAWVGEGRSTEEQECRALCLALGTVRGMADFLRRERGESQGRIEDVGGLAQMLQRQRQQRGCKCRARTYKDVAPTLKELSASHSELAWVDSVWAWASTVAHHAIVPMLDLERGEQALQDATLQERVLMLHRLLFVFVDFGFVVLRLERPGNVPVWKGLADSVMRSDAMRITSRSAGIPPPADQ